MGETKSVYLSDDNAAFLENHPNASDLVDRLLTQYRDGGTPEDVVKQFQLRQARQQLESLEARTDTQREYVEELESEVTTAKEAATEEIDDLIDDMKAFNATISRDAERTERIAAEYYGGSVDKAIEAVKERAEERSDVDGGITDD